MEQEIKVGETVRLNSDGPLMCVSRIYSNGKLELNYFLKGVLQTVVLYEDQVHISMMQTRDMESTI